MTTPALTPRARSRATDSSTSTPDRLMPVWLLIGISVGWIPLAFLFDGVTVLMLPLRLGGSATDLGLVSFVGLAVGAGLQPVVGRLSDVTRNRVDRRLFT